MTDKVASKQRGIVDWKAKQIVMLVLLGDGHHKSVVRRVAASRLQEPGLSDFVDKIYDSYRKWGEHLPSGKLAMQFWKWARQDLCFEEPSRVLFSLSVGDFVDLLPSEERQDALSVLCASPDHGLLPQVVRDLKRKAGKLSSAETAIGFDPSVRFPLVVSIPSMSDGLSSGKIDHANFYRTPVAAKAWDKLVDSRKYRTFAHCVSSLEELVKSDAWKGAIDEGKHDAVVMLGGGGSPEKDLVLMRSILSRDSRKLEFVLLDASWYMIRQSLAVLRKRLPKAGLDKRVYLWGFADANFLNLEEFRYLLGKGGRVIWGITGVTFGNSDEREFFRSLNVKAVSGDLLIVSADTFRALPGFGWV